jgi:O-antigen ligase
MPPVIPLYATGYAPEGNWLAGACPLGSRVESKASRYWGFLAALWAFYFLLVFSVGRYPELTQTLTWGGALIVGTLTAFAFFKRRQPLPREAWLLWGFAVWCLTGLPFVINLPAFTRALQMAFELAMITTLVGVIIRNSGSFKWFYFAFIGSVFFNVLAGLETLSLDNLAADSVVAQHRSGGLTGNANGLGFYCFIGLLSVMGLFAEIRSLPGRVALLATTLPGLYGLVVSASRGAFTIFLITLLLWPLMCLKDLLRYRLLVIAAVILFVGLAAGFGHRVLEDTYLGKRMNGAIRMEDNSSQTRFELFTAALKTFAEHPIAGVGVGQFRFVNGFDLVSHDEWGDLLSGTGLVGFSLYMSMYVSLWLRLRRASRRAGDVLMRYRLNFAKLTLVVLVISGMLFRSHHICIDSMFLIALVVGTADWAERQTRKPQALPAPSLAGSLIEEPLIVQAATTTLDPIP